MKAKFKALKQALFQYRKIWQEKKPSYGGSLADKSQPNIPSSV